jgi:hypothetical protein
MFCSWPAFCLHAAGGAPSSVAHVEENVAAVEVAPRGDEVETLSLIGEQNA